MDVASEMEDTEMVHAGEQLCAQHDFAQLAVLSLRAGGGFCSPWAAGGVKTKDESWRDYL